MSSPVHVGVGLPVYNGDEYLAPALESLLAQTYSDFELVISDNASTDGTEAICREFSARDPRIRYIRRDVNRGAAWNFNSVVRETSGRYFRWAAHDDLVAPTCLERCVAELEASPQAVLAYPRAHIIDEQGIVVGDLVDGFDLRGRPPHERLAELVRKLVWGNAAFGMMRRDALVRTRLLGSFPSADYVLLAELALIGEIREIEEFLFFRRDHAERSRRANVKPADVAEWFAPGGGERPVREFSRLFVEHLRVIRSAPVGRGERIRCFLAFADAWLRRNGVFLVEEWTGLSYTGGAVPFRRQRRG